MNVKRILIIDDDLTIANIYQNKFRVEGYESEAVGDGASALERLHNTPVDLVILDLSLPGMSGLEVLKQIRSRPETQSVPVIVFSNTYLSSMMEAAWKAGATKCLPKAISTPREVMAIVEKIFADGPVDKKPHVASVALRQPLALAPPVGGAVPLTKSDKEFQADLVAAFLTSAPLTTDAIRKCYQTFLNPKLENLRLANLHKLGNLTRSLTGAAGVVGLRQIARLASALEAFLKELHARPADITPSTVRTIAQATDKLALLVANAATPTGQVEVSESPMILVVDDESVSREIIVRAIAKTGLRAMSLDNSTLALQVLEQNRFDLIFLDIKMPKPDGIEVCARVRDMPRNRTTPVVFVTANSNFENRVGSGLSGGNDFIAKPILVLEVAVKALTWLFNEDVKPLTMAGANFDSRQQDHKPLPSWSAADPVLCPAGQ